MVDDKDVRGKGSDSNSGGVADEPVKPWMRGRIHEWAVPLAVAAGIVLAMLSETRRAAIASGVFSLSLVLLLAVSATYHRVNWKPSARAFMRRLDHASIFVLIAGTYTPLTLASFEPRIAMRLLWIVWAGALIGVVKSIAWVSAPKWVTAVLCVMLGWSISPYFGEMRRGLGGVGSLLLLVGGVAYTLGAAAYALKRPKLWPRVFGYHELFHVCTIVGAGLHFAVVLRVVAGAR